jgi:RNA polymerase sigma-70 factor, ECF subfamily
VVDLSRHLMMKNQKTVFVQGIISGNRKVFEQVFNAYYQKLVYFAKEFVCDGETARELVQETFVKLWEIHEDIKPDSNPGALLYTILRNKSLNYLKQLSVRRKYEEREQKLHDEFLFNSSILGNKVFDLVIFNELQEHIENALNTLTPRSREVFELSRDQGLKYREIAEKLEISVNTVENHMVDVLKKLREYLKIHYNLR